MALKATIEFDGMKKIFKLKSTKLAEKEEKRKDREQYLKFATIMAESPRTSCTNLSK